MVRACVSLVVDLPGTAVELNLTFHGLIMSKCSSSQALTLKDAGKGIFPYCFTAVILHF